MNKAAKPLPTATAIAVEGHAPSERLCLYFKTADKTTDNKPIAIGLKPPEIKTLLYKIAAGLASAPLASFHAVAQSFGVRGIEAVLVGQTPSLKYEIEAGITLHTTIDASDLRKLRDQVSAILEHLDSLGSPIIKH